MERRTVRLSIRGRVQGVGYRWWAVREARRLGLDGWVRKRRNGSVELVAAGPAATVDRLIEACRRGPPAADVSSVDVADVEDEVAAGFHERPTA